MALNIGELLATLKLKDEMSDQLKKAGQNVSDFDKSLGVIGKTIAAAFTVTAIKSFVFSAIELGSHIDDLSKSTNIGTDELQKLSFAGKRVGLDLDSLTGLIGMLTKKLSLGDDSAVGAVAALGLNLSELKQKKPDQLFTTLVTEVGKIKDPILQARIGTELFGRSYQSALRLANDGLLATMNSQEVLNAIINREGIATLDKLGDQWTDLIQILKVQGAIAFVEVMEFFKFIASNVNTIKILSAAIVAAGVAYGAMSLAAFAASYGVTAFTAATYLAATAIKVFLASTGIGTLAVGAITLALSLAYGAWKLFGGGAEEASQKASDAAKDAEESAKTLSENSREHFEKIAADAQKTYEEMAAHPEKFTQKTIAEFKKVAEAAADALKPALTQSQALSNELDHLRKQALMPLSEENKKTAKEFLELGKGAAFVAEKLGVSESAVTKLSDSMKEGAKKSKEKSEALKTLSGYQVDYARTLATIDPLERKQIENYLKMGASISDIAKAYPHLTKAQLDSVEKGEELRVFLSDLNRDLKKNQSAVIDNGIAIEANSKAMADAVIGNFTAMSQANIKANDLMAESTMTSVQLQIRAIKQKADADIVALNRADVEGYQRAKKAIEELAKLQISQLIDDDELSQIILFANLTTDASKATKELNEKAKAAAYDGLSAFFSSIGEISGSEGIGKFMKSMGFMVAGLKLAHDQSTIMVNGNKQSTGSFGALSTALSSAASKTERFAAAMVAGVGIAQGAASIYRAVGDASTRMGASMDGAMAGLQSGAMFGPWGAAAGAAIGIVAGLFTNKLKKAVEEANKEIKGIEDGLIKTYGSMDQLRARAELLGVAFVDFGQQGKVGLEMMKTMAKELEERTLAVRDAASKVTAGFAAMVPALTTGFSDIAKRVTDTEKASRDAAAEVKRLTDQGITSGVEFEKANELAKKTANELTQALSAQHKQSLILGQSLKDVGLIGVASFAAAYASTRSYSEALKQVGPSLATLGQAYKDLGLDVEDVALKHLVIASTVQQNNPALMAAIDGQAGAMQGLAQLGLLNVDTFSAMQRTGMEMYGKLQSEVEKTGGTTRDALLPMQSYLQQAAEQARLLGIPLDANTQELIDQSVALGIWKDKGKSANDLLIEGMSTLVNRLNDLISGLTNIPSPTFTVTRNDVNNQTTTHQAIYYPDIDYRDDRDEAAHGGLVTKNGIQFLAYGGMVSSRGTDTVPAMLTPGEAVLTTGAVRSLGTASISRLNSGGSLSNDDVIDELRLLRKQQATSDRQLPLLVALSVRDAMQLNR